MKFFQEIQQKVNEGDKSDFKRQELQHELGHERNNIAIIINGKTWKVVPCRGYADSKEEWSHLNNMKSWAEKKSASTGKKWTVSLTGAPVSETAKPEVQQPVTEDQDNPVVGAIIHRIMVGRTDLLAKYGPKLIMAATEDVADYVGDVEEIGSSDVSGWVKQVERMLEENPPEAFGEASEGPSMYYSEELARKVFALNPNLSASGRADELLDAAWPIAVQDLGKKSAESKFAYDEDFPSDFVSAYAELQKHGELEEGWKEKLGAAALAGTLAFGAAGNAMARVTPDGQGGYTGGLGGKPVATQMAPAATQAAQPSAELPGKNLQAVDSIEGDKSAGFTITQDGKSYDVKVVPKGSPTPRGGKMMKVTQAQVGERGIGNYVVYLLNGGTAYLYMGGVSEGAPKRPVAPDPQNYDSDWDYYNDRDEDEDEMKDDDADYENMIDEASLAAMRDYFNQPDDSTSVTRAPARTGKPNANVPQEIQILINKMYHSGKVTPEEFKVLQDFQRKTKINVGIKEAMGTGNQGYDNMLTVMKAVDAGEDATFELGGEPVTLEYPEARFLAGKYKAFLKAGRQEEFLKYMNDPVMFDRLMLQLRQLIDKQKNFKGSVPGERGVEEAAPAMAKLAGGLGLGVVAAAGAPAIVGILGPLLGIPMAAYGAYSAAKLGMKGVEKLWDMAADKLGSPEKVEQYATAQIAKLPPEQAHAASAVIKQVAESRRANIAGVTVNENEYYCKLSKTVKLIPEGYKKLQSGYLTRK